MGEFEYTPVTLCCNLLHNPLTVSQICLLLCGEALQWGTHGDVLPSCTGEAHMLVT